MGDWFLYVVLAGMIGLMFMNSRKRKKQLAEVKASIVPGAQIILHSGITGRVVSIDNDRVVLESTPGTKLTVVSGAVRGLDSWSGAESAEKPAVAAKSSSAAKPAAAKPAAKPAAKTASAAKPAAKRTTAAAKKTSTTKPAAK